MSIAEHETGSDRIAEAVLGVDADIVVNVQGDEPFTRKEPLEKLIEVFKEDKEGIIDLASLMQRIDDPEKVKNPNVVKVITDNNDFAMYFSRSPIPYPRDEEMAQYFEHIGVYAFRKQALLDFAKLPMLNNEASEKIEAIRYLEYSKKIKMIETSDNPMGINTPEDYQAAKKFLNL
jgi:3-deoxy-manno-octulosonate cytidylyltransferase (CMP-KDO synthetase)